jgi:hypothetical protein
MIAVEFGGEAGVAVVSNFMGFLHVFSPDDRVHPAVVQISGRVFAFVLALLLTVLVAPRIQQMKFKQNLKIAGQSIG